ncbi:MAG: hypothetical protein WAN51_12525 [Alphaproteobacteria bacterium]
MANLKFTKAVTVAMGQALGSDEAIKRLDLSADIVNGWRNYFDRKTPKKMVELVQQVAKDNKIDLATYEADTSLSEVERVIAAAEMVLCTVDGFYRKMLTRPN